MRSSVTIVLTVAVLCFLAERVTGQTESVPVQGDVMTTGCVNKTMSIDGTERRYVVYVPYEYEPAREWPLVLFLHGAGERGDDGLIQSEVGIGRAIRRWSERFPCIVVMPQCPRGVWWDKALPHAELAMEQTRAEYRIDPARVYLTGLSMGGYGTWLIGAREPVQYAALMPICGGGEPGDAKELARTPIWAFHGGKDGTVKPEESRRMVEAVKKAGGDVQYTEFPDLSHNSWDAAYSDKDAIAWMLKQRR